MSERAIHLGLLVSALAVCIWVFVLPSTQATEEQPSSRLAGDETKKTRLRLPPGAALELSADLNAIRQAPLGRFLAQRLAHAPSAERLTSSCGFDPLTRLDELAVAIPRAGLPAQDGPEEFGIVASGRFSSAEILHCATSAIRQRGGNAVRSRLGRFDSVRDEKAGRGEVAARDGTLIVSGGAYFRELLDAATGNFASNREAEARSAQHELLRRALGGDAHAARLTWLLGEDWLERVSGGDRDARLSPFRALKALAMRVDFDRAAQITVLLDCDDGDGAEQVANLARELRGSASALPLDAALLGAAARVRITRSETRLRLDLELSQAELGAMLDLLLGP